MTPTLADPRTDLVRRAADDVDHLVCPDCWTPGTPAMCGEPDDGSWCREDCGHPTCPMCEIEWEHHENLPHGTEVAS